MTQEQKAKAYDEALKQIKECAPDENGFITIYPQDIFPELLESEDERIRKELIEYIRKTTRVNFIGKCSKKEAKKFIDWLEKQDKQKSIWHNEDEEPQRGSLILLIMQSGTPIVAKIIEPNHTFNHGEKWAYIDDLIKKQGEEKPVTIDIDKMVDDYANNKERGNEEFGKPVNCMIRAYRQGLKDAIGKVVLKPTWSEEDETGWTNTMIMIKEVASNHYTKGSIKLVVDWLESIKERIGG